MVEDMAQRGWVYNTKRIGPRTDPCGTLNSSSHEREQDTIDRDSLSTANMIVQKQRQYSARKTEKVLRHKRRMK